MTWRGAGIGSYRYGSRVLWTVDDDLAGSRADRFADRVEFYFRSGGPSLLVDLRQAGLIDSSGSAALTRLCAAHPGLRVVGRPAGWEDCPLEVRRRLLGLAAATDLESALAAAPAAGDVPERRRNQRIPLQLPVEVFFAGGSAAAALQDISRGGVRLRTSGRAAAALCDGGTFDILGVTEDPLGREFFGAAPVPVRAVSVCAPAGAAIGARFTDCPPPV